MSVINLDDDQRWMPTHVQVTVLRARGLRAKGKHGTSDVYTVIQVGKEKFTTSVVEKTTVPEWSEECTIELLPGALEAGGRGTYPPGSSDLALTVMHRALIGPDVFLGHVILPLDTVYCDRISVRNEWYKLRSKASRKDKERGELQLTVQFTRNNLTASMFDLSVKDKPRSAFGKLKDRMAGKMRRDAESTSAIVSGDYAILTGGGRQFSGEDVEDDDSHRSKVKSFLLKGKLRRSSDAQSSTSLASECSGVSSPRGSLSPTTGVNMLVSDLSNSPSEDSTQLASSSSHVQPIQPPPKLMTHKRAFSDEVSKITVALPRPRAVETLRAQSPVLSRSSLCINGIHVYGAEPPRPAGGSTLPATLGLLQKCAPLSRSLQNLARRTDDPCRSPGTARRWSFDRAGKEEKVAQPALTIPFGQSLEPGVSAAAATDAAGEGKKQRRNYSALRRSELGSDASPAEQGLAPPLPEERSKGWFSAKDSQNKPSEELSAMVETRTDVSCHPSPCTPNRLLPCTSPASASPGSGHNANPFTQSPATPPISPSNPFLTRLQCNPFYEELLADQALKCALPSPPHSASSPHWPLKTSPTRPGAPKTIRSAVPHASFVSVRERPRGVFRQKSLPALLSRESSSSPNPSASRSLSGSSCEWDESFEAFATSRLRSPQGPSHRKEGGIKQYSVDGIAEEVAPNEVLVPAGIVTPLPPRWPVRTPVKEGRSDSWLDRAQELAVKKEACLLSQTDAASMLHRKEGEHKRNGPRSFQDHLSDRENKVKSAECLIKPSSSNPPSRHVFEDSGKGVLSKSIAVQRQTGQRVLDCKSDGSSWNHRFQHSHTSGEQGSNYETNLSSTPEFFALELPDGADEGFSSNTLSEIDDKPPSFLSYSAVSNRSDTSGTESDSADTMPTHTPSMASQKSHLISAITLDPVSNTTSVNPMTDSTVMTDVGVNTHIPKKSGCDSPLSNVESDPLCRAMINNVLEINNNTDKYGLSLLAPSLLPDEVNLNKCRSLTPDTFTNSSTKVSVDCGDALDCTPVVPGPIVGSTVGSNKNVTEVLVQELDCNIYTKPLEPTSFEVRHSHRTSADGSHSALPSSTLSGTQVDKVNLMNTHEGNATTEVTRKACSQEEWPRADQKTKLSLSDTSGLPPIGPNVLTDDLDFSKMFQGNLEDVNSNLTVVDKASEDDLNDSGPTTSYYLEKNEPRTFHEPGELNSCTAEDKTFGESPGIEHVDHPVKNTSNDISSTEAKDGSLFKVTCPQNDPSLDEISPDNRSNKQEISGPSPKPNSLHNESVIAAQPAGEGSEASLEAEFCRKDGSAVPDVAERPPPENATTISFEDLHAKVAPGSRYQTQPKQTLHGCAPCAPSTPFPASKTNTPSAILLLPALNPPTEEPPTGTEQPTTTLTSTPPPVISSAHTVLQKEPCLPPTSLSYGKNSPHLVKPLTTSVLHGEKKLEGRSVLVTGLEKLKSSFNPGRSSQVVEPEGESSKSLSERSALYEHLTNNEIIALLLQREAELEKKGAEIAKQEALLEKREVEIKKMRLQVRDLEDYIDRLLVRIMEQTPTILQVRSRFK